MLIVIIIPYFENTRKCVLLRQFLKLSRAIGANYYFSFLASKLCLYINLIYSIMFMY